MGQGVAPWRAIAAFALASGFFCYGFIHRVAPSVMVGELMAEFAVGAAVLGNLAALYFWAYAGLQIPVGVLLDRLGPRRLVAGAAAIAALGSVLFGLADSLAIAGLGRLLIGVGAAFSWVGCLTVATQMFAPARFPLLAGIAQTVGVAGAVFAQVPLALAMETQGWRGVNFGLGAVGIAIALGFWLVARDPAKSGGPGMGLLAGLALVARNPQTWACALFSMSLTAPIQAFAGLWGVPYLQTAYGLDKVGAGQVTTFIFYGWIAGAVVFGLVMDRLGPRRVAGSIGAGIATASFAATFCLPGLSLGAISGLLFLHGLSASVMLTGFVVGREQNPPAASGASYGLINTHVVGIGAVMQIIIGAVLDMSWGGAIANGARVYEPDAYRFAFLSLTVLGIAGFLAGLCFKEPRRS